MRPTVACRKCYHRIPMGRTYCPNCGTLNGA
jgi:RNA polymerase subunit RPABC4/transcription elongation factor Spt4